MNYKNDTIYETSHGFSFSSFSFDMDFYNEAKTYFEKNQAPLLRHPKNIKNKIYVLPNHRNLLVYNHIPEKKYLKKLHNDFKKKTTFEVMQEETQVEDISAKNFVSPSDLANNIWKEVEKDQDYDTEKEEIYEEYFSEAYGFAGYSEAIILTKKDLIDYLKRPYYKHWIHDENEYGFLFKQFINIHPMLLAAKKVRDSFDTFNLKTKLEYLNFQHYIIYSHTYYETISSSFLSNLLSATFLQEEFNNNKKGIAVEIDYGTYESVGFHNDSSIFGEYAPNGIEGNGWISEISIQSEFERLVENAKGYKNYERENKRLMAVKEKINRLKIEEAERENNKKIINKRDNFFEVIDHKKGQVNFEDYSKTYDIFDRFPNNKLIEKNLECSCEYEGEYVRCKYGEAILQIPHGKGILKIYINQFDTAKGIIEKKEHIWDTEFDMGSLKGRGFFSIPTYQFSRAGAMRKPWPDYICGFNSGSFIVQEVNKEKFKKIVSDGPNLYISDLANSLRFNTRDNLS